MLSLALAGLSTTLRAESDTAASPKIALRSLVLLEEQLRDAPNAETKTSVAKKILSVGAPLASGPMKPSAAASVASTLKAGGDLPEDQKGYFGFWMLRATAAIQADRESAGLEAAKVLKRLGAADSDKPAVIDLLAALNIKGWLDTEAREKEVRDAAAAKAKEARDTATAKESAARADAAYKRAHRFAGNWSGLVATTQTYVNAQGERSTEQPITSRRTITVNADQTACSIDGIGFVNAPNISGNVLTYSYSRPKTGGQQSATITFTIDEAGMTGTWQMDLKSNFEGDYLYMHGTGTLRKE